MPGIAVAWVDDEPQPGLVRVEFVDAHGMTVTLVDKVAVFDGSGRLGPSSSYPCPVVIDCEVLGPASGGAAVSVQLMWSVEGVDGRTEFEVEPGRLGEVER